MELLRLSSWVLLFTLCCFNHSVSAFAEDETSPATPANLQELKFRRLDCEEKAQLGFRVEGLQKEQENMEGEVVGRILKGASGVRGKGVSGGRRGYRRPPGKGASSATSLRLSESFPLLISTLFVNSLSPLLV